MKKVPISALARYADNPKKYVDHRGGIISKEAVRRGERFHEEQGSYQVSSVSVIAVGIIIIIWLIIKNLFF